MPVDRFSGGVRAIAVVEFSKAAVVLLAGFGALGLLHHDVGALAARLVAKLHLNPAKGYPRIFLDLAESITDSRIWLLAAGALAYALCRALEAYGLWHERAWAEWFGAATGAIYVPFEILELWREATWLSVGALAVNFVVVAYLGYAVYRRKRE